MKLCNCPIGTDTETGAPKACTCRNAMVNRSPSNTNAPTSKDGKLQKICKCGLKSSPINVAAKSSHTKTIKHSKSKSQKTESGKKDVTNIYMPSGPLDFLKACFGRADDVSSYDIIPQPRQSRSSKISGAVDEEELRNVALSETQDLHCPGITKKVLCDVKLKIKPGSHVETCSSYWRENIRSGTETSASSTVNSSAVTPSASAKSPHIGTEVKPEVTTLPLIQKSGETRQTCKLCCPKCCRADEPTNYVDDDKITEAEQTSVAKSLTKITADECNGRTCQELKKLLEEMIIEHKELKKEMRKVDRLVTATNVNEIKPAQDDQVKSKEIVYNQSQAVQAICTCDAETQGGELETYSSGVSKEFFCKSTSCSRECRKCGTVASVFSASVYNEFVQPKPDIEKLIMDDSFRSKNLRQIGVRDDRKCNRCEALYQLLSRIEVVTLATFIVCMLFYLCFTKMSNLFNHSKCRHTFC